MSADPVEIHIISDSTGDTASRVARAAQAQFSASPVSIVRHPRVTTLDGVQWSADRAVLRVTRWCLDDVGCGREPVEVAVEMVPGGAAVAAAQTGAVPIDGWVEGVASQTTRLWSGFGLALGDGSLLWPTAVTMRSAPPGGTALVGGWSERSATR